MKGLDCPCYHFPRLCEHIIARYAKTSSKDSEFPAMEQKGKTRSFGLSSVWFINLVMFCTIHTYAIFIVHELI